MKTLTILCVLCILTSLSGCKYKNEALELQKQNQDLVTQLAKSDSLSNVYRLTLKEIEAVFDSIMPVDNALDPTSDGRKISTRLKYKLEEINDLFLEKDNNYNALNSRLINSNRLVSEATAKIEDLNSEIRELENVNFSLREAIKKHENQIAEQSSQIESLILDKQELNQTLETRINTINSAFYIADSERELRNKDIIEKTGGFLGFLGRVNTLNPELDKNQLEMIDLREKTTFILNAEMKQVELITNHHSSSYELTESSTGTSLLTIKDPAQFWKFSKYLLITY